MKKEYEEQNCKKKLEKKRKQKRNIKKKKKLNTKNFIRALDWKAYFKNLLISNDKENQKGKQ